MEFLIVEDDTLTPRAVGQGVVLLLKLCRDQQEVHKRVAQNKKNN